MKIFRLNGGSSGSGGGSGGGLTSSQVQALIDNAGHANQSDVQPLIDKERHTNLAQGILAVYDPIRSFVSSSSASRRWFKIADFTINGTFRGFSMNYRIMSRFLQSQGIVRLHTTNSSNSVQFLRTKTGIGATQAVLMREDTNPTNYHLLLKIDPFNSEVAMMQEVFKTRNNDANLIWNVDYQETTASATTGTTQTVTDYTGFTQIGSVVL